MFGGSIDAMKKAYEQNRALIKQRPRLKQLYSDRHMDNYKSGIFHYKKADPEVLRRFKEQLMQDKRNDRIKRIFLLFLTTLIIFSLFGYILFF